MALDTCYSGNYYVQKIWEIKLYNVTTSSSVDLFLLTLCLKGVK